MENSIPQGRILNEDEEVQVVHAPNLPQGVSAVFFADSPRGLLLTKDPDALMKATYAGA